MRCVCPLLTCCCVCHQCVVSPALAPCYTACPMRCETHSHAIQALPPSALTYPSSRTCLGRMPMYCVRTNNPLRRLCTIQMRYATLLPTPRRARINVLCLQQPHLWSACSAYMLYISAPVYHFLRLSPFNTECDAPAFRPHVAAYVANA